MTNRLPSEELAARRTRLAAFDGGERLRRTALVIGAVLLIALLTSIWTSGQVTWGADASMIASCAADYRRARNAVDSAIVDRRRPMGDDADAASRVTCGELRREGRLPGG